MSNMRVKDIRPAPAEIEYKNMKFLITDRPNDQTIHTFIQVSISTIFFYFNLYNYIYIYIYIYIILF
jgi:hypothetical protein